MDDTQRYITYVRERITDLRTQKDVSEHRMSLELGKSGSYIRGITSGAPPNFSMVWMIQTPCARHYVED